MRKLTLTGLAAISHEETLKTLNPKTSEYYPLVQDIRNNCNLDITFIDEVIRTTDDISEAIPYLFDRFIKEENPNYIMVLGKVFMADKYLSIININKLIEKYKSFDDTWIKNNPNGDRGTIAHLVSMMIDKGDLDKIYDILLNDETLGDTRVWLIESLNKYKANQKFYDYLISHKDMYKERESVYGIYPDNIPYQEGEYMNAKINYLLGTKKWKKFAEEKAK